MKVSIPVPSYVNSLLALPQEILIEIQGTGLGKYSFFQLEGTVGKQNTQGNRKEQRGRQSAEPKDTLAEEGT